MKGSYPDVLRNIGGSTQVPTCALNKARRGTWDLPQPEKLDPDTPINAFNGDGKPRQYPSLMHPICISSIFFWINAI
jgi:hypothetical protein